MASMSNDVATSRDRLQQKDQEMSTNHGRLQEVSQQMDIEARRRMNHSEYKMTRLEGEIRSEQEFQKRSDHELKLEVGKYRDEASLREAENRTIQSELCSQSRQSVAQGQHSHMSAPRRTPPSSRPASAGIDRSPTYHATGQDMKAASEAPSDQWTKGRDPWSASRSFGGDMEFDLIKINKYERSREFRRL